MVLIVVVTLLRQIDRQHGKSAALGLILGNLIAGVAAGIAYNVILLGRHAAVLRHGVSGGDPGIRWPDRDRGQPRWQSTSSRLGPFVLLLGLSLSPLPGSTGEAFVSRILNIIFASAYATGALSSWSAGSLNALCRSKHLRRRTERGSRKMAEGNSRAVRATYFAALMQGLGATYGRYCPALLLFKAESGCDYRCSSKVGVFGRGLLCLHYRTDNRLRQPRPTTALTLAARHRDPGFPASCLQDWSRRLAVKAIQSVPRLAMDNA